MRYFSPALALVLALALPLQGQGGDARLQQYFPRSITLSAGPGLPYRLYKPESAAKASLPLLLLLHSITERGSDGLRPYQFFKPLLSDAFYRDHPCVIAMPQCPSYKFWWQKTPMESLQALVPGLLKEYPEIDPQRVYVLGISLGGYGVYAMLAKDPGLVAAAVSISGDPTPAGLNPNTLKDLPIWIFHGAKDPRVPVSGDRALMEELKYLDKNAKYTEYPEGVHKIWPRVFADEGLWDWLFRQKRNKGAI